MKIIFFGSSKFSVPAVKKIKENYANAYEPWKEEDDLRLKILNSENKTISEIAQTLMRQPGAIRSRLKKLGLID